MLEAVGPVIVMSQTPQARLDPADNNRHLLVHAADQIAVNDCCIIRPLSGNAARRIGITAPALL